MPTETTVRHSAAFDVWNEVPLVPQTSGMSCWAAAAAMIVGWRERRPVDATAIVNGSDMWTAYRDGLRPTDVNELARVWNLVAEERPEWTVDALRQVLQDFGPAWMGEASPGLHSIVVTGMFGDGTADGTFLRINDPWPVGAGERYVRSWREFADSFHEASSLIGVPAHVLHARPEDAGRRRSWAIDARSVGEIRSEDGYRSIQRTEEVHMSSARFSGLGQSHALHADEYSLTLSASVVPGEEKYLNTGNAAEWSGANPLASHGGRGENLYLRWNDLPDDASEVDVIVHLHGYQDMAPDGQLTRHKAQMSGLDVSGRARPTLAILPRGRRITPEEVQRRREAYDRCVADGGTRCSKARSDVYTFPGLLADSGGGLEQLVAAALSWLSREKLHRQAGHELRLGRFILTAHSGGGAPLDVLLQNHTRRRTNNPDEVHVFDALYGSTSGVISWLRARISAGAADGGLRITYRDKEGTAPGSRAVAAVIRELTTDRAYRAESVRPQHNEIPGTCGPVFLRDVRADLPSTAVSRTQAVFPLEYEEVPSMYNDDVAFALSLDSDVRAWLAADAAARGSYDASVSSWIAAQDTSGIELVADDAARTHFLHDVDWSRVVFPGWEGDSTESRALFTAIAVAVPERRATRLRYRNVESEVVPVPGQGNAKLWPEARDKFLDMATAARHDGITLRIKSSFRSEAHQRSLAARNPNPNAVAHGHSAHSYGLAIDFDLSTPGHAIENSTRPMTNVVLMYRSPVYKWLAIHAREFGFFPYRMEPWHFEYNPPGFRERYESAHASASSYGAPLGLFEAYRADPPERANTTAREPSINPRWTMRDGGNGQRLEPDDYPITAGVSVASQPR